MNNLKLALVSLVTVTTLSAITITGHGTGNNEQDSLKESLSDLSNRISVNIKSDFKTYTTVLNNEYSRNKEKMLSLSSSLPIKGAVFETLNGTRLTKTTAHLNSNNALILYIDELKRLKKNIQTSVNELRSKSDNFKYNILTLILSDIENFNKHKIVAILLGGKNLPLLDITQSSIKIQLQQYEQKVTSIKIASKILTKDIKQSQIYISAIKPSGSNQVTQFAKILKDTMSQELNTIKYSSQAKYFLRGNYEILKNSIFVTVNLSDINNNILKTLTATLDKSAYKNTKYKLSIKTFDESLNSDFIKQGKLFVSIGFKGFSRASGIDLVEDDAVDIVVKTNKSMCYFLVGHTLQDNNKFSYILPIGSDNTPFINQLTGDDVNQNITIIDEVPISAPFGNENLQIFSSTFDKNGRCPLVVPNCQDNDDGYCVVNGKPKDVIVKTRGLNLKKKKYKIEQSESSISFTSFKK